jgi:transposase-like protein
VRKWVRQAEIDAGARPGATSEESAELKRLRRENNELRRANEILKAASAFFASQCHDHDRPVGFARFFAASRFDGLSSMCDSTGHPGRAGRGLIGACCLLD